MTVAQGAQLASNQTMSAQPQEIHGSTRRVRALAEAWPVRGLPDDPCTKEDEDIR